MSYEQISDEMAEIMLRTVARDEAQEHDDARYAHLQKKLEAMEWDRQMKHGSRFDRVLEAPK